MRKDYDQLDRDYNKLRDEHNELERKYYELKWGLNDVDHAEKGASEKKRVRADETAYTPQPQNLYLPQYSGYYPQPDTFAMDLSRMLAQMKPK